MGTVGHFDLESNRIGVPSVHLSILQNICCEERDEADGIQQWGNFDLVGPINSYGGNSNLSSFWNTSNAYIYSGSNG